MFLQSPSPSWGGVRGGGRLLAALAADVIIGSHITTPAQPPPLIASFRRDTIIAQEIAYASNVPVSAYDNYVKLGPFSGTPSTTAT